jgi:hypothetical protein
MGHMQKWISKGRQLWKRCLPHLRRWSKVLRLRHVNLFFAMALSLGGAVVIAVVAALVLAPRLNIGTQTTPPADLTRLSLTIAAGVGGVVALVVAYRRQRDLEQGRFVEGFGAAAKQLGDSDVAVRLAGARLLGGAEEDFVAATASTRPGTVGMPISHWSVRKLAGYLGDRADHPVRIGREALRTLLHRHQITFQHTGGRHQSAITSPGPRSGC